MWADLPEDIFAELTDSDYSHRQHYSRATYALGCHGPLCRKKERDRARTRNRYDDGKLLDITRQPNRMLIEDDAMEAIIEWHLRELAERRELTRLER